MVILPQLSRVAWKRLQIGTDMLFIINFCDLLLQHKIQEWTATKRLETDWQFAKRNCYRLSRFSWALAQIFCWRLAWHSVTLATYKEHYRSFFVFESAVCQLVALCLFTTVLYYCIIIINRDAVLGSLIWFFSVM